MPDTKTADAADPTSLASVAQFPELGAPPQEPAPAYSTLDDMDDNALKRYLSQRGFEMHRNRNRRGMGSQMQDVKGKKRLTVHLPNDLHQDMMFAMPHFDMSKTEIIEQALREWLHNRRFRRPGTTS